MGVLAPFGLMGSPTAVSRAYAEAAVAPNGPTRCTNDQRLGPGNTFSWSCSPAEVRATVSIWPPRARFIGRHDL